MTLLEKKKVPPQKRRGRVEKGPKRPMRKFDPWFIRMVLLLRYGVLENFGRPIRTYAEVARLSNQTLVSAAYLCQRYTQVAIIDRRKKEH